MAETAEVENTPGILVPGLEVGRNPVYPTEQ